MPFSSLVNDVAAECILEAVGPSKDYIAFVRGRSKILGVSRSWNALADSILSLWTHIVVTPRLPIPTLQAWLARTRLAPLVLEIDFAEFGSYYGTGDPSARLLAYARRVFPVLIPVAYRFSSLLIRIDDAVCSAYVMEQLASLSATMVKRVRISCVCPHLVVSTGSSRLISYLPLPLFATGAPLLTHLSIASVGVQWDLLDHLESLRSLELRQIARHALIPEIEYWRILNAAPLLSRLVLVGMPVTRTKPVVSFVKCSAFDIVLSALEYFEVDFGGSEEMGRLVSRMQMPSLISMVLHIGDYNTDAFIACVGQNQSAFSTVTSLELHGDMAGPTREFAPVEVFRPFLSVEQLDLRHTGPSAFHLVVRGMDTGAFVTVSGDALLQKLQQVVVGDVSARALHKFIELRMHWIDCRSINRVIWACPPHRVFGPDKSPFVDRIAIDVMLSIFREEYIHCTTLTYTEDAYERL
ncbi:hypothetical protein C8J57DRAFT_1527870 [Mycena rebaudengoi]|nr:hypothetical protein C8J57DRAFT_1527870 [Mycena rebaudengoi]